MKNLDDCAVLYLQNGKLGSEKVNGLDNGLKFKSAYLKKNKNRVSLQQPTFTFDIYEMRGTGNGFDGIHIFKDVLTVIFNNNI